MSKENKTIEKQDFLSPLKSSPSLRSWKSTFTLLRTITVNICNELRYTSRGVRQTEIWKDNEQFLDILKEIQDKTLLTPNRLFTLYQFAKVASNTEGDIAELGVYKGGSAKLLAKSFKEKASHKKIFLLDTFEGLPKHNEELDHHREGDLGDTSFENVQTFLKELDNIILLKGLFSNTQQNIANNRFSFVHIDVDLYSSVLECCNFFYPRLSKGGIMIFDDYGYVSCPGAKKAVDEFFRDKADTPVYLTTGQCLLIKH